MYVVRIVVCSGREERNIMAAKIDELSSLLASSQAAESQWRGCCDRLEAQILEKSSRGEILASVKRKLMDVEEECSRMTQELGNLTGELEAARQEKTTLLIKVHVHVSYILYSSKCSFSSLGGRGVPLKKHV